tara:strand:+ start:227 stop:706 length:480 start_codon:yes stop_codon:yes gene_type:complete
MKKKMAKNMKQALETKILWQLSVSRAGGQFDYPPTMKFKYKCGEICCNDDHVVASGQGWQLLSNTRGFHLECAQDTLDAEVRKTATTWLYLLFESDEVQDILKTCVLDTGTPTPDDEDILQALEVEFTVHSAIRPSVDVKVLAYDVVTHPGFQRTENKN